MATANYFQFDLLALTKLVTNANYEAPHNAVLSILQLFQSY